MIADSERGPTARPVIFSSPMVNKIVAGRKTQTRRLCRFREPYEAIDERDDGGPWLFAMNAYGDYNEAPCPYGACGDRLWVRETWSRDGADRVYPFPSAWFRADFVGDDPRNDCYHQPSDVASCLGCYGKEHGFRWRSPIHMPRSLSRITLEIAAVRVERLQAITEADACAEGLELVKLTVDCGPPTRTTAACGGGCAAARDSFAAGWDTINGKRAPWKDNPMVWAITFKRIWP